MAGEIIFDEAAQYKLFKDHSIQVPYDFEESVMDEFLSKVHQIQ